MYAHNEPLIACITCLYILYLFIFALYISCTKSPTSPVAIVICFVQATINKAYLILSYDKGNVIHFKQQKQCHGHTDQVQNISPVSSTSNLVVYTEFVFMWKFMQDAMDSLVKFHLTH